MNKSKLNRMALVVATVTLASAAGAQTVDNWKSGNGDQVWRNGTGELCWRNSYWTPATAHPDCDGAIKPPPPAPVAQAPAPAPEPAPAPVPAPPPPPAPAPIQSMSFQAETLFDFDKSVIKPTGKTALDGLVAELSKVNVETLIAVGHTDAIGTDAYNQALSIRRVEAVKAYLVSKGVPADQIKTEGKGESQPVASNQTRDGRAQNRRVEIEVVGTRKP
ncbi:outer membrane protein OmpA [Hydrogenophaga sp. MI9]|uniref:outer membrane protein OmpA n=1 Tax=Hydrogenophaga sp. MI9 TaxID=3453719 RepID=UPI003EE8984B